jgi:acyl-CoA synthetase (AMP-forming)/AMP-acid ligase II
LPARHFAVNGIGMDSSDQLTPLPGSDRHIGSASEMLAAAFGDLSDLVRSHAAERGDRPAVNVDGIELTWHAFDRRVDAIAAALQRDGLKRGDRVAICAMTCPDYAAAFIAAIRAGGAPAPMPPSATAEQLAAMLRDAGAPLLLRDGEVPAFDAAGAKVVAFDDGLDAWIGDAATPADGGAGPDDPFNVIYSSGTTGTPKGIVHSRAMRWRQLRAASGAGFGDAVTLLATPLYSNTTLVSFLPTLAYGGTAVLMKKFDARRYLELAEATRATHTMLVPVQYRRIMADPCFESFDLSAFRFKTCTSAPFAAALKADVLRRWPGKLVEYYGMTEGGASFALVADEFPDKLHTVGRLLPGHAAKLIDEDGHEVGPGEVGEVVGRSATMMSGYLGQSEATRAMLWTDPEGNDWFRQGDVGRFDDDGFLILMDRRKDMIISGGFNVFPSDIEAVVAGHPDVLEVAVVGVPSEDWGETPVAFAVPRPGAAIDAEALRAWTNARVGKTQRLHAVRPIDELPRSAIGKVLKRALRDRFAECP